MYLSFVQTTLTLTLYIVNLDVIELRLYTEVNMDSKIYDCISFTGIEISYMKVIVGHESVDLIYM